MDGWDGARQARCRCVALLSACRTCPCGCPAMLLACCDQDCMHTTTCPPQEACRQAVAAGVPVWFEPVSVPKSTKAAPLLSCITYASPNEKELAAMAAAVRRQQQPGGQQQQCGCRGGCGCGGSGSGGGTCCTCKGGSCTEGCCCCCCTAPCCDSGCGRKAAAGGAAGGNGRSAKPDAMAASPAEAALRAMLPDIATLLLAGLRHLVLTLGADGAALCTLAPGGRAVEGGGRFVRSSWQGKCAWHPCWTRCVSLPCAEGMASPPTPLPCSPPCACPACQRGQLQRRRRLPRGRLPIWLGARLASSARALLRRRGSDGGGAERQQRPSWAGCCSCPVSSCASTCQEHRTAPAAACLQHLKALLNCR